MNVPAAIRELEKIEMIRRPDGRYMLDHAVTATQKEILSAFGLDEKFVMSEDTTLDAIGKSKRTYEESRNWRAPQQQACLLIWSSFKACTKCKY